jgi:hypothetical protein
MKNEYNPQEHSANCSIYVSLGSPPRRWSFSAGGYAEVLSAPLVAEEPNNHSVRTGLVYEAMCNVFENADICLSLGISQPEVKTAHTVFVKQQRSL